MITDPTWIFFIVVCIIFSAPMIFSKLRIPHLVGMILAGVVVGEHGLNLLQRDASFEMFGKVGIYFIMFLAGLEMNMQNLKQNRMRGVAFGTITTVIPFLFGLFSGLYLLNYSIEASLLLACIFASHTLVSYSIVGRYGVTNDPSVTVSVLATMIALLSALLFLAGMSGVIKGDGIDALFWIFFILRFGIFILFMFWVLPRIIRVFFRKFSDPIMLFTFTIAVVFLSAAMAAELCGLEGIFGAFLAGLVLNRFIPSTSPLMNRLEFVAGAIFIPYFLIGVGMLVNVRPLFYEGNAAFVVLVMVVAGLEISGSCHNSSFIPMESLSRTDDVRTYRGTCCRSLGNGACRHTPQNARYGRTSYEWCCARRCSRNNTYFVYHQQHNHRPGFKGHKDGYG